MSDQANSQSSFLQNPSPRRRVLIVGGVAGGASCAARLRRLDESVEIVVFDRGPYVSFANCGLPYYVGNVIADERKLLVASREMFRERFNIEVHTDTEVTGIDRSARTITVRDGRTGNSRTERYDALVLSPGAAPIRPPLPGVDLPGVFAVRTIPDSRRIRSWITDRHATTAVVVGGGFIGLEMVENLVHRELAVTVLEKLPQVMPPLDPEMAVPLMEHLVAKGVRLQLGDGLARIEDAGRRRLGRRRRERRALARRSRHPGHRRAARDRAGQGGRPCRSGRAAALSSMRRCARPIRTSGPSAMPSKCRTWSRVKKPCCRWPDRPIVRAAWPPSRSPGVRRSSAACRPRRWWGAGPDRRRRPAPARRACGAPASRASRRVYLHPGHHAGYYPGARPIHLKLLFSVPDGRILGAQAVGLEGVEKRIDVIATAIQFRGTVHDLAEAELCYAPQFGAAKDPVNLAGMLAENVLNGDMPVADWLALTGPTRCWSTCANPTSSPAGTFPTRSTCRSRSCAPGAASCPGIATSGSAAPWDSERTTRRVSWRSTDIDRGICLEGYTTYKALKTSGLAI